MPMKHLSLAEAQARQKDLPEGEIIVIMHEQPVGKSAFILTPTEFETQSCLGMKLKGQVFMSSWFRASDPPEKKKDAMYQMLFIQKAGWFNTGEKRYDDLGLHKEALFRCVYCGNESTDVKGPCSCRREGAQLRQ